MTEALDNDGIQKLRQFVQSLDSVEDRSERLKAEKREVYAKAKAEGFDKNALSKVMQRRKQRFNDEAKLSEQDSLIETYEAVLEDSEPHTHAHAREAFDQETGEVMRYHSGGYVASETSYLVGETPSDFPMPRETLDRMRANNPAPAGDGGEVVNVVNTRTDEPPEEISIDLEFPRGLIRTKQNDPEQDTEQQPHAAEPVTAGTANLEQQQDNGASDGQASGESPVTYSDEPTDPFDRGRQAYMRGHSGIAPDDLLPAQRRAWTRGWCEAQAERSRQEAAE